MSQLDIFRSFTTFRVFSFLVPAVSPLFFLPPARKCQTALQLGTKQFNNLMIQRRCFCLFFCWPLAVFTESPLFPIKTINLLSLHGKKSQWVVFRWGQKGGATVCALSVLGTAWHVQAPVRCLQSFSINREIRPSECCLAGCVHLLKFDHKSAFITGYVGLAGSLRVCSLVYLWTKTRSVASVEILHKS